LGIIQCLDLLCCLPSLRSIIIVDEICYGLIEDNMRGLGIIIRRYLDRDIEEKKSTSGLWDSAKALRQGQKEELLNVRLKTLRLNGMKKATGRTSQEVYSTAA
jgi:hypothetical protein